MPNQANARLNPQAFPVADTRQVFDDACPGCQTARQKVYAGSWMAGSRSQAPLAEGVSHHLARPDNRQGEVKGEDPCVLYPEIKPDCE